MHRRFVNFTSFLETETNKKVKEKCFVFFVNLKRVTIKENPYEIHPSNRFSSEIIAIIYGAKKIDQNVHSPLYNKQRNTEKNVS